MLLIDDLDRSAALVDVAAIWTLVLAIDLAITLSYTLWPRRVDHA